MPALVHEGSHEGPSFSYSDVLIPPLGVNRTKQGLDCSKMEMNSPGPMQSRAVWVRILADYSSLSFLLCFLLLLSRLLFYFISSNFVLDILKDGFLLYPNKTEKF